MIRDYSPTSNRARAAFAVLALTITVALGVFVDTLAYHYGPDGTVTAQSAPVVVAAASRG